METRHVLRRISPTFDGRWLVGLLLVGVVVAAASYIRWGGPAPPIELVALGPDGTFADTVAIPAEWGDTVAATPDGVARVPLILAARNLGIRAVQPERIRLSVPVRYKLLGPGGRELESRFDPASPLASYTLLPELPPLEPERLPQMLPAYDTLWLEPIIPRYYCVALADSIPDFVVAPPPSLATVARVRVFYSFEGGSLGERRTGTFAVSIDTTLLMRPALPELETFAMQTGRDIAQPALGTLRYEGSRSARCGEPEAPMELLSSVWATGSGGRFIALDYGGAVRKHLYDLDGDGVIERESWDPDGDGDFEATRRARIPIPDFLLPAAPARFDMAALDTLPPDSQVRLDPFRGAMPGPGTLATLRSDTTATGLIPIDSLPAPRIQRPRGPLGSPVRVDTGGGG
jgi:hypothetical protein